MEITKLFIKLKIMDCLENISICLQAQLFTYQYCLTWHGTCHVNNHDGVISPLSTRPVIARTRIAP